MLAPISDSIWRIQNSPWGMYKNMLKEGFHDYFWLERLGNRSRAHEAVESVKAREAADEKAAKEKAAESRSKSPAKP